MQKNPKAILLEYKDADVDRRLHMFLAYRELRDQFRAIDCSETGDQRTADEASPKSAGLVRNVMRRFVSALTRFMRFPDLGMSAQEERKKQFHFRKKRAGTNGAGPFPSTSCHNFRD